MNNALNIIVMAFVSAVVGFGIAKITSQGSAPDTISFAENGTTNTDAQFIVNAQTTHLTASDTSTRCQCPAASSQCDRPVEQNTGSFQSLLTQMLANQKYDETINLYNSVKDYSDQQALPLREQILAYLSDQLKADPYAFSTLLNRYLDDYYDDIDFLLLKGQYFISQSLYHESIDTFQQAQSYALSPAKKRETQEAIHRFMTHIDQQLSQEKNPLTLIELYEYADQADILLKESYKRLVLLYIDNEQFSRAETYLSHLTEKDRQALALKLSQRDSQYSDGRQPSENTHNTGYETAISLVKKANQFLITTYVEEQPVTLLIDTGASMTVVTQDYFDQISHEVDARYQQSQQFNTANGPASADIYLLKTFKIGEYTFKQLPIAVMDFPINRGANGLLGMNVLEQFRFEINQSDNKLYLTPLK